MAPKRKGGPRTKPEEPLIVTGQQALQLKEALDSGKSLDNEALLILLHAFKPCEGLYSKACKVRL